MVRLPCGAPPAPRPLTSPRPRRPALAPLGPLEGATCFGWTCASASRTPPPPPPASRCARTTWSACTTARRRVPQHRRTARSSPHAHVARTEHGAGAPHAGETLGPAPPVRPLALAGSRLLSALPQFERMNTITRENSACPCGQRWLGLPLPFLTPLLLAQTGRTRRPQTTQKRCWTISTSAAQRPLRLDTTIIEQRRLSSHG